MTDYIKIHPSDHALLAISLNSTSKWRARVLPSLLGYMNKYNRLPKCITASFAAYIQFYRGNRFTSKGLEAARPNGDIYTISDDQAVLAFFYEHRNSSVSHLVSDLCKREDFWGIDLTEISGFQEKVIRMMAIIQNQNIYELMRGCIE